jgi:hypothetical protein
MLIGLLKNFIEENLLMIPFTESDKFNILCILVALFFYTYKLKFVIRDIQSNAVTAGR